MASVNDDNAKFVQSQDAAVYAVPKSGSASKTYLEKINRYDLPIGFSYLDGLRGYFFMTRPNLNIFDSKGLLTEQATKHLGFNEFAGTGRGANEDNIYIAKMLTRGTGYPSSFILPITNNIKSYSPEDQKLDVVEHGETYYGQNIRYAKHAGQSRKSGSISVSFTDDKLLTLYKLMCLWTEYGESVYLGEMEPKPEYIWTNELDYAASSFFFATRTTADVITINGASKIGYELVFWDKLTGIYPVTRPDSAFAYTRGQLINPEFNVEFDYSLRSKSSILDPYVLSDFNTITSIQRNKKKTAIPSWIHNANGTSSHGAFQVNVPNVFRYKGKFYMEWL